MTDAQLPRYDDDLAWRARSGYLGSWICTDAQGHYPVGFAAVVVAVDEGHARALLDEQLAAQGLPTYAEHPYTLVPLGIGRSHAQILVNGDY